MLPYLAIFTYSPHTFLVSFLHSHQASFAMSNFQIEFILLQDGVSQFLPFLDPSIV
jgi:hypothetical protein